MKSHKVSMGLSDTDIANAEWLFENLRCQNKAEVVSKALHITKLVIEHMQRGLPAILADGTIASNQVNTIG